MWDKEGSGLFGVEGLRDWTKYIHLCYWVIIAEDAVEVSILDAISEIKKKLRKKETENDGVVVLMEYVNQNVFA